MTRLSRAASTTAVKTRCANGGGRVVNTSAGVALFGIRNMCAYTPAKSGVVGMTRQVAIEYAAQNVKVNSVAPGIIDTPILASVDDQTRARAIAMTPTKRLGKPEDLARAMIFLLGQMATSSRVRRLRSMVA
jgi:NAD(P)-dependent dehydrogenase (short-subunit alcohol dehydrogenase family)